MKKLAACAAICGVLIGCDTKPCTPKKFDLGQKVLIHNSIPAVITQSIKYSNCSYGYRVLLNETTIEYFDQVYIYPYREKRKLCLTTRTEMGIFHPCSKKEHELNKPIK